MRTPLVAGNWKMHLTVREAVALAAALRQMLDGLEGIDVVVCPPYTALADVGRALAGSSLALGAQNVHWAPQGAFTGEIAAPMLRDLACTHVIVGHSERRHGLGETDAMVQRKIAAAFAHDLVPILCVGETLEEREAGGTEAVLQAQVRAGVADVTAAQVPHLVVAYEPVWAIGTGRPATGAEAGRVAGLLRAWLRERFGEAAQAVRVLYGGSVTPQTIEEFAAQPDVDGALVGGASLQADAFAAIVRAVRGVRVGAE
ncbi:MAG: triose-phosphate isomerase [Armatimonadota bacterium]|nr:triose-phosphate isomerase [Armatimonadota bacterium]MDR7534485.1 triose-phosphate isomerase [Armatimonadota bacterium]MDR7535794.1 triose-phosphate isomerase [Armatimonadota bacterium]